MGTKGLRLDGDSAGKLQPKMFCGLSSSVTKLMFFDNTLPHRQALFCSHLFLNAQFYHSHTHLHTPTHTHSHIETHMASAPVQ